MLTPQEVIIYTGHEIGGVCPFGIESTKADVYLDQSLKRFSTIFPAAGSYNSAVEMTNEELYICSSAKGWVDVSKNLNRESK